MPTGIESETPSHAAPSPFRAWLEILRVPNLFTVPGDPIVGFLLASMGQPGVDLTRMICPALSALFLYCAGLVSNDVFDLEEDRRERPERPIPSGRISRRAAVGAAGILFVLGIASAFLAETRTCWVACALALLILLYNGGFKRITLLGPLTMGLCRGFSLLLGASVVAAGLVTPVVLVAAAGLTLYVMSVTLIAAKETTGGVPAAMLLFPGLVVLLWLSGIRLLVPETALLKTLGDWALTVATAGLVAALGLAFRRDTDAKRLPGLIGWLLRLLLLIEGVAANMLGRPGTWFCIAFGAAALLSARLSRRFYAS